METDPVCAALRPAFGPVSTLPVGVLPTKQGLKYEQIYLDAACSSIDYRWKNRVFLFAIIPTSCDSAHILKKLP